MCVTRVNAVLDAPTAEGCSLQNEARLDRREVRHTTLCQHRCSLMCSLLLTVNGDVNLDIAALRNAVGARSDTELAALIGVGRSAISQWRKRGAIPDNARARASIVEQHLSWYARAHAKFISLPEDVQTAATALSIAFIYRQADGLGKRMDDTLRHWSGAWDQVRLAAALLLVEEMRMVNDVSFSFDTILHSQRFMEKMTDALLPTFGNRLPQSR